MVSYALKLPAWDEKRLVLILNVVEDGLVPINVNDIVGIQFQVLILVVVDDGLVQYERF